MLYIVLEGVTKKQGGSVTDLEGRIDGCPVGFPMGVNKGSTVPDN